MQIVLARLDDAQEIVKVGRVDIGEQHKFRSIKVPSAVIWLNEGTSDDVANAERFASAEGYTVLCYENEPDPLSRARSDIMRRA